MSKEDAIEKINALLNARTTNDEQMAAKELVHALSGEHATEEDLVAMDLSMGRRSKKP